MHIEIQDYVSAAHKDLVAQLQNPIRAVAAQRELSEREAMLARLEELEDEERMAGGRGGGSGRMEEEAEEEQREPMVNGRDNSERSTESTREEGRKYFRRKRTESGGGAEARTGWHRLPRIHRKRTPEGASRVGTHSG